MPLYKTIAHRPGEEPKHVAVDEESEELIKAEWDEQAKKKALTEYKRKRLLAYRPVGDQLDMLYHDMKNGTTQWLEHVETVKQRYPKP